VFRVWGFGVHGGQLLDLVVGQREAVDRLDLVDPRWYHLRGLNAFEDFVKDFVEDKFVKGTFFIEDLFFLRTTI